MDRKKIVCGQCGYFIAVQDRGNLLTVKYKDLYIYFEGGILREICPKCGIQNFIVDTDYKRTHPERVEQIRSSSNVVEAKFVEWVSSKDYQTKTKEGE